MEKIYAYSAEIYCYEELFNEGRLTVGEASALIDDANFSKEIYKKEYDELVKYGEKRTRAKLRRERMEQIKGSEHLK